MANIIKSSGNSFSLHETSKPKFQSGQIKITESIPHSALTKDKRTPKLVVGRSGKIGYSK